MSNIMKITDEREKEGKRKKKQRQKEAKEWC